jgi:hypothetical protein
MPPTAITRSIFFRGSEQRPFLLPLRFHGAPGVEAATRCTGQNSCADNELAGAPEEIRTPDPQIRSLVLYSGAAICLIIPCSSAPTLRNNIIQKGLAFGRDWSGSIVNSGR